MLSDRAKLSIAVLVFFVLGLPAAVATAYRQGFGRHAGWLYLVSLPVIRIAGASCQIAADQNPSVGLIIASSIMLSVGLAPLLLAIIGITKRVNDGQKTGYVTPRVFQVAHILTIVALALTIAGGVKGSPTNTDKAISQSGDLRKTGAILFLVSYLFCVVTSIYQFLRRDDVVEGDKPLVFSILITLPFFTIRVVYTLLKAFNSKNPKYFWLRPNIYVTSFMQFFMEVIIFTILVTTGLFFASRMKKGEYRGGGIQILGGRGGKAAEMESGVVHSERHG